jgi:nanoRNase/pAp phosphatase (c-di-AMP/oligoRNAs hydrolase)
MRALCAGEGPNLGATVTWVAERSSDLVVVTGDPAWQPPEFERQVPLRILLGNPAEPSTYDAVTHLGIQRVFLAMNPDGPVLAISSHVREQLPDCGIFLVYDRVLDALCVEASVAESPAPSFFDLSIRRERARALLQGLSTGDRVLILTHNDPDPDAISSAAALAQLLRHHGIESRIAYGGTVARPENRKMISLLGLDLLPADQIDWREYHEVAIVDGQPGPNCVIPEGYGADIVIDHHVPIEPALPARHRDVDPRFGSAATLLLHYLEALQVPVDTHLATALFYGIKTDTRLGGRDAEQVDLEALMALRSLVDAQALAEIERAEYTPEVFRRLSDAAGNAVIHDGVLVSFLGTVDDRDTVAQAADFCTRVEGVAWVLVAGLRRDRVVFSVRTVNGRGNAGEVTCAAFQELGSCGGRQSMAGGDLPVQSLVPEGRRTRKRVRDALLQRFHGAVHP